MQSVKQITMILMVITLLSDIVNATPILARQYELKCNACHVGVPPTLNKAGQEFLRNGMRFSASDTTTLKSFLREKKKLLPVGFFVGGLSKSIEADIQTPRGTMSKTNDVTNPMLTLFVGGSLSDNFSTFIGARFAYSKKDSDSSERTFNLIKRKAYLQYNQGRNHIFRAGILYPYPETSENSGLADNLDLFISPIDRLNLKPLYGVEYSYLMDSGLMVRIAGGVVGKSNDERTILTQLGYNGEDFSISAIVTQLSATNSPQEIANYSPSEIILGERTSLMLPFEYDFGYGYLNVTGVFEKNDRVKTGDYYGLESSITTPIFETGNLRFIYTTDNEDKKGYALKYSHIIFDHLFINANLAKFKTNSAEFQSLTFGINFVY
ncbi:MAG: hypothetical protein JXQ76_01625 [Campylobacterales bacterium]|nr:hypothetical protein [Campylobacterales bacterium]